MELPKDPNILIGVINTKLRDYYPSLEELAEEMNIDLEALEKTLGQAGYYYVREQNAFKAKK